MIVPDDVRTLIAAACQIDQHFGNPTDPAEWRRKHSAIARIVTPIVNDATQMVDFEYTETLLELLPKCAGRGFLEMWHESFCKKYPGYYKRQVATKTSLPTQKKEQDD